MAIWNERIRSKRLQKGITLAQIADKLGVTEATAQRYESGSIKNIPYEHMCAYGEILGCSPAYLMGWENKKTFSEIISDNIKTYRQSLGISPSDIAEHVGISEKDLDDFEKGIRSPSLDEILNLAKAFDISADKLLSLPENTDHDIQELFLANKFNENNYKIFKVHVSGKDQIWISDREAYYKIDTETFNSFVESINNYIAFNIKLMLSKATPIYYNNEKNDTSTLNAAHARTDITWTDEAEKHDKAIMDDDSEWE